MKVLVYAGGEYVTGDAIAAALLEYSQALADAGSASSVEIPIVRRNGGAAHATFLVGPASQIVAVDADSPGEELVDEAVVARLRALTRALQPIAYPVEGSVPVEDFDSDT